MSSGDKISLNKATQVANRFMLYLDPFVSKSIIVGSIRRKVPEVGDIEIVCVPKDEFSIGLAFPEGYPGLVTNGVRLKRFKYPEKQLQIELYITTEFDYGRMVAIRTGSSAFSHINLAMRWNRMGFAGTTDGLRLKRECEKKGNVWRIKPEYKNCPTLPPVFDTEVKFFQFLGIPWVPPTKRSWKSKHEEINYKL